MTFFAPAVRALSSAVLACGLLAACPASSDDIASSDDAASPTVGDTGANATGAEADTAPIDSAATASEDSGNSSGSGAVDLCSLGAAPQIEVGHGEQMFEPLAAHNAQLIAGVQGGYHIFVGIRGRHLDTSGLAIARIRGTIAGIEVGSSAPYAELVCTTDGLEAINLLLIWDSPPDFLAGKTATISVELTDAAGTVVTAEGDVVIDGL